MNDRDVLSALLAGIDALPLAQGADDAMEVGLRVLREVADGALSAIAFLSNGTALVPTASCGAGGRRVGAVALDRLPREVSRFDGERLVEAAASIDAAWLPQVAQAAAWLPMYGGDRCIGGYLVMSGAPIDDVRLARLRTLSALVGMSVQAITLRRSLTEADHMKTEVISSLSHQMRTPLASVKGYATALLLQGDQYDAATRREFLEAIDQEADHLSRLVGDLLESSAIEAGLLHIEPQPVLLPRLVAAVVDEVGQRNPQHRFAISFSERFPVLLADPGRLEQVLHNLLDNAVKYSPDGGLVMVRGTHEGDEAQISVADQGVGIAPEHLNRLFERFFRIKGSMRRPVSGTGLGLPIARAIVEAHGGRIWAESSVHHGSIFYFTLPIKQDDFAEDDEDA